MKIETGTPKVNTSIDGWHITTFESHWSNTLGSILDIRSAQMLTLTQTGNQRNSKGLQPRMHIYTIATGGSLGTDIPTCSEDVTMETYLFRNSSDITACSEDMT